MAGSLINIANVVCGSCSSGPSCPEPAKQTEGVTQAPESVSGCGGDCGSSGIASCGGGVNLSPSSGNIRREASFGALSPTPFILSYNSVLGAVDVGLGGGWDANFLSRLSVDGSGNVTIQDGDGFIASYTKDGSDYVPAAGISRTLVKNPDNTYTETHRCAPNRQCDFLSTGALYRMSVTGQPGQYFAYIGGNISTVTGAEGLCYFDWMANLLYRISRRPHVGGSVDEVAYIQYDGSNNLIQSRVVDCCSHYYTYGSPMLSDTDADGYKTSMAYDGSSRIERHHRGGQTTYFQYSGSTTTVIDGRGNAWQYTHNADNLLDSEQSPSGQVIRKGFGANYEKTASQDALGNVTYFEYNARLNLTRQIDPRNNATYFGYDASSNQILRRDALGQSSYFEYDASRRMTRQIDALGHPTRYHYNPAAGTRVREEDALGNASYFGYDSDNRLARQLDRRRNATYFGYDTRNNRTRSMNALLDTAYFEYNTGDQLTRQIDELGRATHFYYDGRGLQVQSNDPLGQVRYYAYDAFGQVTQDWDALNRVDTFGYDSGNNRLRQARSVAGVLLATYFEYDVSNRQVRSIDRRGFATYFGYDLANRSVKTVVDPGDPGAGRLNLATYFEYDAAGNQTQSIDARGNATITSYDALNRGDVVTDALGNITRSGYDAVGNTVRSLDARGHAAYFGYDALNRQSVMTNRLWLASPGVQNATYYEYDAEGNQNKVIDANGHVTQMWHDALNRLAILLDAAGNSIYSDYDKVGNLTQRWDANVNESYFAYDARNRMTQQTRVALLYTKYFEYDAVGNQTKVTDPRNYAWYYGYDELNRQTRAMDPLSQATYFGYDPDGNLLKTKDRRGNAVYFGYDAAGRRDKTKDAAGFATYFGYDENGNQVQILDARFNPTYFIYDALNRQTSSLDTIARISDTQYDPNGNVTRTSRGTPAPGIASGGQAVYFAYDAENRLATVQDGQLGVTYFEYDGVGNRTRVIDANNRASIMTYDPRNLLKRLLAPDGGIVYFGYDGNANTTVQVDPRNNVTYFDYDSVDRLTMVRDPLNKDIYFGYDGNNNLTNMINAEGSTPNFNYDELNRMTAGYYGLVFGRDVDTSLQSLYYDYDAEGNVTRSTAYPGGTFPKDLATNYMAYDERNLLLRRQNTYAGTTYFTYDGNANVTDMIYPGGVAGSAGGLQSFFDARNRQTHLKSPSGAWSYFSYSPADQPTQRILGNAARQHAVYDQAGRVTDWLNADKNAMPLTYFQYTRDPKGLPTRCVREGGKTIYYSYDNADRLTRELWTTTATPPAQVYSFTYDYDAAGNRIKSKIEGTTFAGDSYFFYNAANALTVKGSDAVFANPTYYFYDNNGSLIRLHDTSQGPAAQTYFAYNAAMLIDRIDWKDGSRTQFCYDCNLQRERTIEHGTATYFLFQGPNILQEVQPTGAVKEEHTNAITPIAGIGQLVETNRPQEPVPGDRKIYPVMDMRGTIHRWLKDDGVTVLASREYDAFGRIISSAGDWPSRFGFQGQAWYELNSLDGAGQRLCISPARIYLPEEGVFASRDPLLTVGGVRSVNPGLYNYVGSNPQSRLDPHGLAIVSECAIDEFLKDYLDKYDDPQSGQIKGVKAKRYAGTPKRKDDTVESEIVAAMIKSPRDFPIAGSDFATAKANFLKHIKARTAIIALAKQKKTYGFAAGNSSKYDPKYIALTKDDKGNLQMRLLDPGKTGSLEGAWMDVYKAILDPNTKPDTWAISCNLATRAVLSVGSGGFSAWRMWATNDTNDWVPGDSGAVENLAAAKNPTNWDGALVAENIIYIGKGEWWGHFSSGLSLRPLTGDNSWVSLVNSWKSIDEKEQGKANILNQRGVPDAGLRTDWLGPQK